MTHEIDLAACRGRQQRLLACMHQHALDLVIVTQIPHVQWLTGVRFGWMYAPAAALDTDGRLTLVAPNSAPQVAAADEVVAYEAQWHATLRNDQRAACCEVLRRVLAAPSYRRVGIEFSTLPHYLAAVGTEWFDIEPELYRLRRRKDPDELAYLRQAIGATEQMYGRAREILQPGLSELEMFNQLQAAAVEYLGEMLTGTGNDYQCASMGGPPRQDHYAQAGELYILDLGPAYRGYFADNCRTLAVSEPTELQQATWAHLVQVFDYIEQTAKPGVSCGKLFQEASQFLARAPAGRFSHHLGHGIGLFPHEAPHLNPNWDDTLETGDVFTVEPGLYAPELRAGMRIENDYLVTDSGVECLTRFDLGL